MRRRGAIACLGLATAVALLATTPARNWAFGLLEERCEVRIIEDHGPSGQPIEREAVVCTRGRTASVTYIP